tara:strand:+ start:92 stop:577 length:486 start_codon:yes stop_codon:yes gene_type:complete
MKKLTYILAFILCFSCGSTEESPKAVNTDELVELSNEFQQAYIDQDWETASKWISADLGTTVYNSNGSPLSVQSEDQVNVDRGWNFAEFKMTNHQVFMSSDNGTAVITFDADGSINFNEGYEDVPYATRASQTWVNENGEWKVMHSHWSPRENSQGIPQQN